MVWAAPVYVLIASGSDALPRPAAAPPLFEQQRREADFRYGLVRVRDGAGSIALPTASPPNAASSSALRGVVVNWRGLIRREFIFGCFTRPYSDGPAHPAVPGAARLSRGAREAGRAHAARLAFQNVVTTLSWFVFNYRPSRSQRDTRRAASISSRSRMQRRRPVGSYGTSPAAATSASRRGARDAGRPRPAERAAPRVEPGQTSGCRRVRSRQEHADQGDGRVLEARSGRIEAAGGPHPLSAAAGLRAARRLDAAALSALRPSFRRAASAHRRGRARTPRSRRPATT